MDQPLNTAETKSNAVYRIIHNNRLRQWSKLLAKFLSVQICVQAIGLVSGILLIRKLSQTEYAYYTVANSMQSVLVMLADVGLMNALSATGGNFGKVRFALVS